MLVVLTLLVRCFALVQCCFTSTETIRTIRDGEASTYGHLDFHTAPELPDLPSSVLLYVHRDHKEY